MPRGYIRKRRRAELANATCQMRFDGMPVQVPSVEDGHGERRMVIRTSASQLARLGASFRAGATGKVTVINDIISSRRAKKDADNEHGLWTRYDILWHDVVRERPKDGVKARLVTRDYPEGILVRITDVGPAIEDDPICFGVTVRRER